MTTSSHVRLAQLARRAPWRIIVAFVLGCLSSALALSPHLMRQQREYEQVVLELQGRLSRDIRLRAIASRMILSGQGPEWAERQLRELPFIVAVVRDTHQGSDRTTEMLCEFRAMYAVGAAVPSKFTTDVLEGIEASGICGGYNPALF